MLLVNEEGKIVLANENTCNLFGYAAGDLNGKALTTLVPERYHAAHDKYFQAFAKAPRVREMGQGIELNACRADGSNFPVEVSLNPYVTSNSTYTLVTVRAIAERKATETRIRHLNRVLAMRGRINSLILRAQDCEELFGEACRIAVEAGAFSMTWIGMLDAESSQWKSRASFGKHSVEYLDVADVVAPFSERPEGVAVSENRPLWIQECKEHALTAALHERCSEFGWRSLAAIPLQRDGQPVGVLALYASEPGAFDEEEMKLLTDVASNLSFAVDHFEKETRLKRLVDFDGLTGLGNRAWFMSRIIHHLRKAGRDNEKLAVLQLDVERFKNINDGLGHCTGDLVLQQVAKWLVEECGENVLLARLDADHFAAILPEVQSVADIELMLQRWMSALRDQSFGPEEDPFRISMKVGISVYPEDGINAGALFNHAEAALRQAKASRNRYLFHTRKMSEMTAGKFVLENQLRLALDREEFVLYYQPKVDANSGKLTGAEALIRWNDPHTGLVQPNRFIPMLEETGLIREVGRWALGKAVEDALRWRKTHSASVRIAVNVSPLQLRDRQFLHNVETALARHPDAAANLELEVTEGMIMEDTEYCIEVLRMIRAMGVTIAVDDFGTGFSSLSYLAKLPLDTLKIDRSFVVDVTSATERLSQISAIVNLAHSKRLKVVAEGVETEEQLRLLRMLGCDQVQGFLFSKPLPSSLFTSRYLRKPVERVPAPILQPCRAGQAAS